MPKYIHGGNTAKWGIYSMGMGLSSTFVVLPGIISRLIASVLSFHSTFPSQFPILVHTKTAHEHTQ